MSTPEQRIRTAVEKAKREKASADAKAQEREAAREHATKQMWQRASALGEKFRVRARELVDMSQMLVYVLLEMHKRDTTEPGFLLKIGRPPRGIRGVQVVQKGDGWEATIHDGGTRSRTFVDDAHLERSLDELLEPLVEAAAVAVVKQEEQPGEER